MTARVADCDRLAARGQHARDRSCRIPRRSGFTLIELMIVIVIIIILISILVPAVGSAIRNAREGQVKSEISQLESAIADFKAQFGVEPPSVIDFTVIGGVLPPATQAKLRRIWPNIDMMAVGSAIQTDPTQPLSTAKPIPGRKLAGSECLVFFLGGVVPAVAEVPVGFSSNPRNPFGLGGRRVGPFFEFQLSRLYDLEDPDGPGRPKPPSLWNGYEGYLDPLPGQTMPYYYITSDQYQGQWNWSNDPANPPASKMPVYKQSANSFFNPNGFQIISPGPDGVSGDNSTNPGGAYGVGGIFSAKDGTIKDGSGTVRTGGDLDNITNFHGGRLVP